MAEPTEPSKAEASSEHPRLSPRSILKGILHPTSPEGKANYWFLAQILALHGVLKLFDIDRADIGSWNTNDTTTLLLTVGGIIVVIYGFNGWVWYVMKKADCFINFQQASSEEINSAKKSLTMHIRLIVLFCLFFSGYALVAEFEGNATHDSLVPTSVVLWTLLFVRVFDIIVNYMACQSLSMKQLHERQGVSFDSLKVLFPELLLMNDELNSSAGKTSETADDKTDTDDAPHLL